MKKGRRLSLLMAALAPLTAFSQFVNPLYIPDTLSGPTFNLRVASSKQQLLPGDSTDTYGINGPYLGPTLMLRKGDQITMNVQNDLSDATTMHWHGMHVSAANDGGPHTAIPAGTTWSPSFEVLDEAATFWYHPHLHHYTASQVYKGLAGMIIVRDEHSDSLGLPHTYGVDDFPIVIQDKSFDSTNQFIFEALSDTIMINGTLGAYLEVPAQMVRLRLLNGSSQRVYYIGFPSNTNPMMIGSDGGLMDMPLPISQILLAPGERVEMVLDFSTLQGARFPLPTFNSQMPRGISGGPGGPSGGPGNPLDSADFNLLDFVVVPQTANPVLSIPASLNTYDIPNVANASRTREKFMTVDSTGNFFYFDNQAYNMSHIDDTVILDDIEVWKIYNTTEVAHPFHIHDIQFFVTELNNAAPPPSMRARKDVVLLQPGDTVAFVTQFTDFADSTVPYMYHCHNLFHEDTGMMGQFLVMESTWVGSADPDLLAIGLEYGPNPLRERLQLRLKEGGKLGSVNVNILDLQGRSLANFAMSGHEMLELDTQDWPAGIYLLRLEAKGKGLTTKKLVKQ